MNFTNIHLFGFDSCLSEDGEHHSYGFNSGEELGEIFEVLLDEVGGKIYKTLGYQLAQVQHFNEFYRNYGDKFNPVFHGTGLLPDLFDRIKAEAQNMMEKIFVLTRPPTLIIFLHRALNDIEHFTWAKNLHIRHIAINTNGLLTALNWINNAFHKKRYNKVVIICEINDAIILSGTIPVNVRVSHQ